ncbi:MAG: Pycsar system effector family protein [Sphingomonas sp.]|jgi:hypothetical protein
MSADGKHSDDTAHSPARPLVPNSIHLVRTAQGMTLQLSQMADQKASMLMGATFLIFTVAIGQVRAGGGMILPLAVLAVFAFLAALVAILTVLPRAAPPLQEMGEETNILFFGVFTAMAQEDFVDAVIDRLHDDETICRTMLRDIYQNGQVLARRKYRLLGVAYRLLLAGLVLSLILFLGELVMRRFI